MEPSKPARPKITLRNPSLSSISSAQLAGGAGDAASPQTPSGGPSKIRLFSKSQPQTPADGVPPSVMGPPPLPTVSMGDVIAAASPTQPLKIVTTKAGRVTKPSQKKRAKVDDSLDGDGVGNDGEPKTKRIKVLKTPLGRPLLKLKQRHAGQIPHRPLGDGYDSEAEDREMDPVVEEQFVFRMMPGDHCEYIRNAIKQKTIGLPRQQGGADIQMKWLDDESRRCVITVQNQAYAAILLDLPTITEGTKSWDKKSFVKTADICQMLLVFAKVANEQEAKSASLPAAVDHGFRWPHGLTPPMHDCRNRRFRKRLSKLEIQNKEAEVERLLAADRAAAHTKYEFVDERLNRETIDVSGEEYEEEDEDAEGEADLEEMDYFGDAVAEDYAEDDEDLLAAEFMDADETPMDLETPAAGLDVTTPMTGNTVTPAAHAEESGLDGDGDDESGDDEDEDEDGEEGDGDDGEDEERHDEVAGVRVEIANLKKKLAAAEEQLAKSVLPIMRKRIEGNIKAIRSELELKKSSIGDVNED